MILYSIDPTSRDQIVYVVISTKDSDYRFKLGIESFADARMLMELEGIKFERVKDVSKYNCYLDLRSYDSD